jgi:hypothetical protein
MMRKLGQGIGLGHFGQAQLLGLFLERVQGFTAAAKGLQDTDPVD